ncbi:MAG TPA: YbaK/EbsC family protein [Burkholderiaceae bacterium]|nr:YbaK/EbsC family protein [Burkholderiaceae bacterium]
MPISSRLSSYLAQHGASYDSCAHELSRSSAETARRAQIPPHQLAKSVILEDEAGCVMAIVPADTTIMLGHLSRLLGRKTLRLSDERRIAELFEDCVPGAVPPVGMAWDMQTIVDDELDANEVVYMEGGDHESLLRMSREEFGALMSQARHAHFCKRSWH